MKIRKIKAWPLEYKNGTLTLNVYTGDHTRLNSYIQNYFRKQTERPLELDIEVYYKRRTLPMNNLMWALLDILSVEIYEEHGHSEELYQDMLDLYAPKKISKLTGKARNITSSKFNTAQMAKLIDGIFRTLAENGVALDDAYEIDRYWTEFYRWRGEQENDPLASQYENIEDYKRGVVFCEACRTYLPVDKGQVAHIVSTGASGIDYGFNLLRLCTKCHLMIQHQNGWEKLLELYPHLRWKVNEAREQLGKKDILDKQKQLF